MAAHPSYTNDSTAWNMTSSFGPVATNTYVSLTDEPSTVKHGSFTTKKLYYFHSFGGTDRYLISIEQPMQLDFAKLVMSGPKNKSFYECFTWNSKATNKLHVLDRQTGSVQHIDTDLSFFYFHTINGFEESGKLTIDLAGYKTNAIVDDFYLDNLATDGIPDKHKASLRRLVIDVKTKDVSMQDLQVNLELPNINDAYRNQKYRYAYGVSSPKGDTRLAAGIIKYDLALDSFMTWSEQDVSVGEPIFIADPKGSKEDDGIIVVLCDNEKSLESYLTILDARSLTVMATAKIPQHIPPALHGWFYK